ncbi:MAG: helix-turn-helix transcriptional regulator [Eubacteriales bacterium]|nr:helix-turn-helix transcriptional regulator [Eubacteriales bacterium]
MAKIQYDEFIRMRITELRLKKNVSEHRMSLELDKSGSYIRGISSGAALPSLRELFNIIAYFDMTPAEFFAPTESGDSQFHRLCERLQELPPADLEKVDLFLDWIIR